MDEPNRAHKQRRSSAVGVAAFDEVEFAVDVGSREHPDQKFLSYTQAKVKEALTKVRHVERVGPGEPTVPTVMPNGTVYFDGNKYTKLSTCGTNTGSPSLNCFKCCACCKHRPREPSDFEKLGIGVVLYFKYLKIMGCAFFLLTLFATVQFIIFENAGALNEELEAQGGGISSLGVLTMGNLGEGQTLCERVSEGETLKLYCNEGQVIGGFKKILYGQPDGSCTCPQRGSSEEKIFGASLPPDLTSPSKCAADYPYTGLLKSTEERCCSMSTTSSGSGDFEALDFRSKEECSSDIRKVGNASSTAENTARLCDVDSSGAMKTGRGTYVWDIVFNACNGEEKCEVLVDDYTSWNIAAKSLDTCNSYAASDCDFAFGSQSLLTMERNESTFSNCSTSTLKSLAVMATCFDTTTTIMGETTSKEDLWLYLTLTECLQGLTLCFFIWLLRKSQKEDTEAIDNNVITLSDFSVEMTRLSYLINDSKYKIEGEDGKISRDNDLIKEDLKKHFETYLSTCRHVGNDQESKEKNKKIQVHEINFGKADGAIIHHKVHRGKIIKKLAHIAGEKKKFEKSTSKKKDIHIKNLNAKEEKLIKRKTKIENTIVALEKRHGINDPINAYITFATTQGMIRCIDNYPQQSCAFCCQPCCKGKKSLVNGKYRVWLNIAPEAENVWWENLAVGSKMRSIRKFISLVITLGLLFGSMAGVSIVKATNARRSRMYPPVDCKTLSSKYNDKITKSDVELDEMMLSRIERNTSVTRIVNESTMATEIVTTNEITFVEKVTKDSLLQCFCTKIISDPVTYGDFRSKKYWFKPKEDIANISLANRTAIPHIEDYPNGDWCYKFALDFAEIQAYTIGGVLGIILINIILKAVMKILVRFERPHSKSEYSVSLAGKLFIVQLINTGLILLLVNGNLSSMGVDNGYLDGLLFGGDYEDFNSQWYISIGSSLVLTMIINMLTPLYSPIGNCVTRGLKRAKDSAKCCMCCCQDKYFSKQLTQSEYENLWSGGDFELPARYGALEMVYWVTLMYGSGLPILYPLAFSYFCVAYWTDKWAITKLYDRPIQTDQKVAISVSQNMLYAVLLHMMLATWKYSNSKIFKSINVMEYLVDAYGGAQPYELQEITDIIRCGTGGSFSYALTRVVLTAPHMFVISFCIFLYLLMARFILPMFGTLLFKLFPCIELCFSHMEEDTKLTVAEATEAQKLQGAQSYDITKIRQYAKQFASAEESELQEIEPELGKEVNGKSIEMVSNPLSAKK